jgi:hypothetical protein
MKMSNTNEPAYISKGAGNIRFNKCAINTQTRKNWDLVRTKLLWDQPMFSHILYTMMCKDGGEYLAHFTDDTEIPIAATDGSSIFWRVDGFNKLCKGTDVEEAIFVSCHEILHAILDHCGLNYAYKLRGHLITSRGKKIPYNNEIMGWAEDYVINAQLVEGKVGRMPKDDKGEQLGLYDPKIATGNDSVIDVYEKIYKQMGGSGGSGKKGNQKLPGNGKGGQIDLHLEPGEGTGEDPTQTMQRRNEQEWKTQVAAAIEAAKLQGKLPANLERLFGEILEPKIPWEEYVEGWYARYVGGGGYDWRRPERQLITRNIWSRMDAIVAPSRSGYGCGTVVVANDTSGSVTPKTMDAWLAESVGVLELLKPRRLILIWCDAAIGQVDEVEDASDINTIRGKGIPGGGGTDFRPVFDYIAEQDLSPDALIFLTDGYGDFPNEAPSYPVLWGNITKDMKYPFGEIVDVPVLEE